MIILMLFGFVGNLYDFVSEQRGTQLLKTISSF